MDGTQWVLTISKMNDKECTVGLKYASSLDHEYDSFAGAKQMARLMYERYSVLSLLSWVRMESEPSLKHQSASLIAISSMILSATKSAATLRSIPLGIIEAKSGLNVEVYF